MQSHGPMRLAIRAIAHQCGLLGCRVGEASNLALVQTRKLESFFSTRPRRRLGSTQVDSSSDTEFLVRRNSRRHVVPRTMRCGTVGEPDTTVPASPQALIAAGTADVNGPPTIVDALEEDLKMNTVKHRLSVQAMMSVSQCPHARRHTTS